MGFLHPTPGEGGRGWREEGPCLFLLCLSFEDQNLGASEPNKPQHADLSLPIAYLRGGN
jgi:hypothetical protein